MQHDGDGGLNEEEGEDELGEKGEAEGALEEAHRPRNVAQICDVDVGNADEGREEDAEDCECEGVDGGEGENLDDDEVEGGDRLPLEDEFAHKADARGAVGEGDDDGEAENESVEEGRVLEQAADG